MKVRATGVGAGAACTVGLLLRVPWPTLAASAAVMVSVFTVAVLPQLLRQALAVHHLRRRSAPTAVAGHSVHLGAFQGQVFVAGLLRPTIFCDRGLPARLGANELRAVLLHERGHQQARDPLRLAVLGVIAPALARCAGGLSVLNRLQASREIAADRYALARGVARQDLAAALLMIGAAPAGTIGFGSATDLRLEALLHGERSVRRPVRWYAAGAGLGSLLCIAVIHPYTAPFTGGAW